ncbi:MAG: CDP-alcohol phosphatidyltransferase family protein [Rhizobacter sp.]|nr:CDP-alcohol phosphatidyltransferase family protein [Rhizobacter sp.]
MSQQRWPPALRRAAAASGHLLTAARLALSPLVFTWIVAGRLGPAAAALLLAMATDLLDGPLVRRYGRPSRAGAWCDVGADLALVVAAFAGCAAAGVLPWWPLGAIAASFAVFASTTRTRFHDPLGRSIGGVLMTLALGVLLMPDLAAQAALGTTAGIACALTIVARLAVVSRLATRLSA